MEGGGVCTNWGKSAKLRSFCAYDVYGNVYFAKFLQSIILIIRLIHQSVIS